MIWLPEDPGRPCTAPLTSGTLARSAKNLELIIEQFAVDTHPRFQPKGNATYCNIFAWDVTKALGAELPHWWLRDETTVNGLFDWLSWNGKFHGWTLATREEAVAAADEGRPAVPIHRAAVGHGHIAIFRPGGQIAQAGAQCFSRGSFESGFGNLPVTFWTHP